MPLTPDKVLKQLNRPLFLGIGGGYDIFAAVPTYFDFLNAGKSAVLANLSFTHSLAQKCKGKGEPIGNVCYRVNALDFAVNSFAAELGFPENYFPEYHLSKWFISRHRREIPVYTFRLICDSSDSIQLGVSEYTAAIKKLTEIEECDGIILVDAGVDSIIIGDEEGLGTYAEDFLSMLAVNQVGLPTYLQCIGLGTEAGISVSDFLLNLSHHKANHAYLGCFDWIETASNIQAYMDAISQSVPQNSTIHALIEAAVTGNYGPRCPLPLKARGLEDGDVLVHPLMTISFWFDAVKVLKGRLFIAECSAASSLKDLDRRFDFARYAKGFINQNGVYQGTRPYSREFDQLLLKTFSL